MRATVFLVSESSEYCLSLMASKIQVQLTAGRSCQFSIVYAGSHDSLHAWRQVKFWPIGASDR